MEISWIKTSTNIFNEPKILLLEAMPDADTLIVIWLKLLALSEKSNNNGKITTSDEKPYTAEMLSTLFRRKLSTVKLALETFEHLGMIERIDNIITLKRED